VVYEYDTLDRVVRRTVNGADPTVYTYDNASRLATLTYRGLTTTYVWDAANRFTSRTLPNGIRQEIAYDDADRLLSITYKKADDSVIETVAYTYDAKGQRSTKTVGGSVVPETAFTASYDDANRMSSLTLTDTGTSFVLAYDDNGNLASKTDQADSSIVTNYSWDSRNRLTGMTAPGIAASFTYDGLGRRISKTVNGQTIGYVYDGMQAIGEVVGGSIDATLLTGLMIDEVIARYGASGNRTYLTDALGSVLALSKDDQSIQNFYEYSAYGETRALGEDEGNPIQYTGRENDGTGLYYYRARYYDPILKRFVSEDPIGLAGGDVNLYAYVAGNPIQYIDSDGEDWRTWLRAIGVALGLLGTPGVGPDNPGGPPAAPSPTSPSQPVKPGSVPGNPTPDPAKSPTKVPELPRPTPTIPKPPFPPAPAPAPTPPAGTPGIILRPPIPLLCPACQWLLPPNDESCPIA
jgi:RHS repeat-associated protein